MKNSIQMKIHLIRNVHTVKLVGLAALSVMFAGPSGLAQEVIVDNTGGNTSQSGAWFTSSGPDPYLGSSIYSHSGGSFTWQPILPGPGTYEVYAWWTYHANRSTNVPYQIVHDGGTATEVRNQYDTALGGQWNLLGSYDLTAGFNGAVTVSSQNGQASADAVRWVRVASSVNAVKSCTTITKPGFYEVTRNIEATGADVCLVVTADHVVIDVGGFVIRGAGEFAGRTAIGGSATQGIEIRNGTVTNFYVGISLRNAENVIVTDMTFVDILNGAARLGPGAAVRNSFFTRAAQEPTWALEVGRGSIIRDCVFSQNDIAASVGPSSLVINNVVKDSNEDGINIAEKSTVIGNTVVDTFDEGLRVGALSTIVNNNAHGNGAGDLLVTCPSNVVGNSAGRLSATNPTDCNFSDNLFLLTD